MRTNTIAWNHDTAGRALGFTLNGDMYFYIRNLQGDVVGIYDIDGIVVASYAYDAWGNILSGGDSGVGAINPIRYRGYYWDAETGFYYCQTRYYNPEWRRWISADLLCDTNTGVLGTNMYAYCNNNPVMYADPSGMLFERTKAFFAKVKYEFKLFFSSPKEYMSNAWYLTKSAVVKMLFKGLSDWALGVLKRRIGADLGAWLLNAPVILPTMNWFTYWPTYILSTVIAPLFWNSDWHKRDADPPWDAFFRERFSWSLNFAVGWAEWGLGFKKS